MTLATDQTVLDRIRAEYLEMPGMRLKVEQLQRLIGVERSLCEGVLASLVGAKFLYIKSDGSYALLTAESSPAPAR